LLCFGPASSMLNFPILLLFSHPSTSAQLMPGQ
jgi:hypothetical protein